MTERAPRKKKKPETVFQEGAQYELGELVAKVASLPPGEWFPDLFAVLQPDGTPLLERPSTKDGRAKPTLSRFGFRSEHTEDGGSTVVVVSTFFDSATKEAFADQVFTLEQFNEKVASAAQGNRVLLQGMPTRSVVQEVAPPVPEERLAQEDVSTPNLAALAALTRDEQKTHIRELTVMSYLKQVRGILAPLYTHDDMSPKAIAIRGRLEAALSKEVKDIGLYERMQALESGESEKSTMRGMLLAQLRAPRVGSAVGARPKDPSDLVNTFVIRLFQKSQLIGQGIVLTELSPRYAAIIAGIVRQLEHVEHGSSALREELQRLGIEQVKLEMTIWVERAGERDRRDVALVGITVPKKETA
jgi:hypothetical protein